MLHPYHRFYNRFIRMRLKTFKNAIEELSYEELRRLAAFYMHSDEYWSVHQVGWIDGTTTADHRFKHKEREQKLLLLLKEVHDNRGLQVYG
jgi:hypothetical protein